MSDKEITIQDQVEDVITKSGVAFEIDITELFSLAERGKAIKDVTDPNFALVKKEMQQKRKYVTEYFEEARKEFNALSKGVIQVQNLVLAEFTPEEDRLIAMDKTEKERLLKEARLEALPAKRERITTAGISFTDEEILAMDDADFEIEYNVRLGAKLEADRIADQQRRDAEQAEIDRQKAEIQAQKDEAERIEAARAEERERAAEALRIAKETAEREAQESAERVKREAQEAIDRVEREKKEAEDRRFAEDEERALKLEREAKEKADAEIEAKRTAAEAEAKQEADKKYQAFLAKNKFNPETDIIKHDADDMMRIYRFVAEFKITK